MYYINIFNQLNFLITICFSFFISLSALAFEKKKNLSRLIGLSFFIPFFLSAASFLVITKSLANSLMILSDLALIYMLFVTILLSSKKGVYSFICFIIIILPIIIILILINSYFLAGILNKPFVVLSLFFIGFVLNICTKFLRYKSNLYLSIGVTIIFLNSATYIFNQIYILNYISIFLKLGTYSSFFLYFYQNIYADLLGKLHKTQEEISKLNKSLNLEVKKRVFEIERSNEKLIEISKTDSLTKAYNKAAILEIMDQYINNKSINGFSIFMFDIDKFKTINDTLGHVIGDKCIKNLSLLAKNSLREKDLFGRYGGDEFIVVLPGATTIQAKLIAERFRRKVEETTSPHFTVSIGISTYPQDANSVKGLIQVADDALYVSKQKGRNTVSHKNLF